MSNLSFSLSYQSGHGSSGSSCHCPVFAVVRLLRPKKSRLNEVLFTLPLSDSEAELDSKLSIVRYGANERFLSFRNLHYHKCL